MAIWSKDGNEYDATVIKNTTMVRVSPMTTFE